MANPIAVEYLVYNRWANLKLIDACSQLTREQIESSVPGTYGTIHKTLVHLVRAEAGYYRRITGDKLEVSFSLEDSPELGVLRTYADRTGSALIKAAEKINPEERVDLDYDGKMYRFKAYGILIQALMHGVEHRTDITTILAAQGILDPDLSGWEYMEANQDRMG